MVPIKREPLTAFVSDTVAVPAEAIETAEKGVLVVVIGHQVLYPCRRGDGKTHTYIQHIYKEKERGGSKGMVKRYWVPCVSQRFYEDCPGFYYGRNVG